MESTEKHVGLENRKITLVFASENPKKLKEIKAILPAHIQIISLKESGFKGSLVEPFFTLEENAFSKTSILAQELKVPCFSEDSGLEVEALAGAPGVFSARYSGPDADSEKNIALLLENLKDNPNRNARFRAVICLYDNGQYHYFEGVVNGQIAKKPSGNKGFGYDPIFIPDGYEETFAVLPAEVKHQISHRTQAFLALAKFLMNDFGG